MKKILKALGPSSVERLVARDGVWQETTLRKGKHKICRDMFITEYHDRYELGIVKNSRLRARRSLTMDEKEDIVKHYKLQPVANRTFRHAKTYRTPQSNGLIEWLLSTQ